MDKLKAWARKLKRQIYTLYFACRDNRVPWYAKAFTALVVAYAFSPIDLIPDFIPVLGYLDDIILVPAGVWLALKMIPRDVLADCEKKAIDLLKEGKPKNWVAGGLVLLIWALIFAWIIYRAVRFYT
ncbi:YkvA family protein [Fictibacillus fluitans]|uniref:YkvA family protein n=1 Tax=Fictibacillus fluitans TaxID=3058422 RepID=A0ABT8HWJ9_9BACL|nr:YkvA family protein [Fictibacillus sp. NE201]MDN4525157.1 YkvA family protein [Fictibacillus sp. NE201]